MAIWLGQSISKMLNLLACSWYAVVNTYQKCTEGQPLNWHQEDGRPVETMGWETMSPGIHEGITLTCTTDLKIVEDQVHSLMAMVFPDDSGLF